MGFQQGLSGLNASSTELSVIGNNIANSSTYGAKDSRAEFQTIYASALNGAGQSPVGIGTNLATVSQQFTQGNITTTSNPMDLAINGAGFFQVTNNSSPPQYTRNGQFKVDRNGNVVNNAGLQLMGYPANSQGVIQPGLAQPLQLPTGGIAPKVTGNVTMQFNLDSRSKVTAPQGGTGTTMSLTDPSTYNNATSMTAYDAKGEPVALTYYFQKANTTGDPVNAPTDPGTQDVWNVYITANGVPVSTDWQGNSTPPDANGNPTAPFTTINFQYMDGSKPTAPVATDANGNPMTAGKVQLSIPAGPNGTPLPVGPINLDMSQVTEGGSNFAVTNVSQDGYAPGQLASITVDGTGIINATYSNGQSKPAGQVELATFRNPQGLQPLSGNVWAATYTSGDPVVGTPSSGNLGTLQSGALEESNVDLTSELVNMVTAQRAYQANAQTIKTLDQVLQTLVTLR